LNKSSTELKVGIFAIIVIIFLSYMTLKVGNLPMLWEKGYRLYAEFDDISGLDEQSRIKIAGVDAGVVERISLMDGKARVTLLMSPDIEIHRDARVSLRMSGLLGDRYLAMTVGSPDKELLKNGDVIRFTEPAADFDTLANRLSEAANNFGKLAENLESIFSGDERDALRAAIKDFSELAHNLRVMTSENREPVANIIARLESLSVSLEEKSPELMENINEMVKFFGKEGPSLIENLNQAALELKTLISENKEAVRESVENIREVSRSASVISRKIERGEGTLGKLMQDDELYDSLQKVSAEAEKSLEVVGNLRTFLDFHSEYNTGEGEWKGYFDLTLQPRRDKYYVLGLVTDPRGSVETTERVVNGVHTEEEETTTEIEFTAQFARRFEDFVMRIGLMENTFGVGADYFFKNDDLRIKLDAWDFSANEAEADEAHLRIGLDYRVFKYLFISSGVDNLLNSERRGIYVGGGLRFEDEDLKYLLGSMPGISLP
jgi:phospholipid/cholesterol/gamma-HCH transport system substrate-binding protein